MSTTSIAHLAKTRYTTKAFDFERKIPQNIINDLLTLLRFSPSSVNSQPWHFIMAASEEGKARIAKATQPGYAFNESKIRNASHVVVMCARTDMDAAHLSMLLAQEEQDGRLLNAEAKAMQDKTRHFYINMHRNDHKDLQHWMEKQVYLALGALLFGAASQGIDACTMEGFDAQTLDEELDLHTKGLTSIVVVSLGYRSVEDFNAKLPKSRLPESVIFTTL